MAAGLLDIARELLKGRGKQLDDAIDGVETPPKKAPKQRGTNDASTSSVKSQKALRAKIRNKRKQEAAQSIKRNLFK